MPGMTRAIIRPWTPDQVERLKVLIAGHASPLRAAAALNRSIISVQAKAREIGTPFPHKRRVKADRLSREAAALAQLES